MLSPKFVDGERTAALTTSTGRRKGTISVKLGTLDETGWLRPVGHIWTASAQPWVQIPEDALHYAGQPENLKALIEAWRGR